MPEYFIVGNTFAAPFLSERIEQYVKAASPELALKKVSNALRNGVGFYAGLAYASADDYHKGRPELGRWLSNHAARLEEVPHTMYFGHGPGDFELDGIRHKVRNPKGGLIRNV